MIEEMNEIWKTIPELPNYQVSNLGRVKSLERKVKGRNGSIRIVREKILKPGKDKKGYLQVALYDNKGERKNMRIHRIVCDAFISNPNNLPQVNHKNECKTDNRVENLEYCDAKYNCNFGSRTERSAKAHTGVYNTKKSKPVKCLETGVIYPSLSELQRQFGFNQANIQKCCVGKLKSAYKYHWKYV